MQPEDIDLVRSIARYASRQTADHTDTATRADIAKRTNLIMLVAKCGEVLARTLYGIDISKHTKE